MLGRDDQQWDRGDPLTELRTAREARGWSQPRLLHELKTQLSRWENGHRVPDQAYRRLFREIYAMSDEQLGFVIATSALASTFPAGDVPPALLTHFAAMLDQYAATDHLVGHGPLLIAAQEQAAYLDKLARTAAGPSRPELLTLSGRFAEFTGWLHQDAGDFKAAMFWTDRAMDCAHELGDPRGISYVLHRKSNIATDAGHPGPGLGLADAALRNGDQLTPRLRAVALRQRANAHAITGDREACLRALAAAFTEVTESAAPETGEDVASYCTPSYVDMETGSCWLQLREPERAIPILERGLAAWPEGQERDRGLCLSRLATAHAQARDLEAAATVGLDALVVVQSASSARSLDELRRVRVLLAGSRTVEAANEFDATYAALTGQSVA
jgi:transcriptional regulator with XRE-family HTH domain